MDKRRISRADANIIETPYFLIEESSIESNLKILDKIQQESGCKILLALKAFAMSSTFPLISEYLHGVCASGLNETLLGKEFGKEVHTYSPAFKESEFNKILEHSDYIIFNTIEQYKRFKQKINNSGKEVKLGLRVNPETSFPKAKFEIYNPCSQNSRLGITSDSLKGQTLEGITGLHFHALCEQGSSELETALQSFEEKFYKQIKKMEWVNFGGGHNITREDYDRTKLIDLIKNDPY